MSRLVVVLPLVPLREGDRFAVHDWPLHITVVPPFLTDARGAEVGAAVRAAVTGQPAIDAVAEHDELFGRRHDIPVTVMADNESLNTLHQDLRAAVRPFAAEPNELAFTGSRFRPHVTMKRHGRVHPGDRLTLTQVAIVDMAPRSSPGRTVLATVGLLAE